MLAYIITFLAVFFTDIIYVYLVKSIQQDHPFKAACWSLVVTFTASIAVINYTEDHSALIPALLGAFFGTFLGMRLRKKAEIE
jgi:uncharacterized membrane protein YfcA